MTMMQTRRLYKCLLGTEEQLNLPVTLYNGASNNDKNGHKMLKDANEKKVADIKYKRNPVRFPLGITLDTTTLMLTRHDCVGDNGI